MSTLDNIIASIRNFGQKLQYEGWRTTSVARLKFDLKNVEYQRRESSQRLGEKVFDLYRQRFIKDDVLIETLVEHFKELAELEKKARKILEEIQDISLMNDQYQPSSESKTNSDMDKPSNIDNP